MTASAKAFRDVVVQEYLIDFCKVRAYWRAGGQQKGKKAYDAAWELFNEPYVAHQVQRCIDSIEEKGLITRTRVIAGLVRESNREGLDASHSARVSALNSLRDILGMASKTVAHHLSAQGGILVVPETSNLGDWEKRSAEAQRALKEAVRK